jgi:hypothetical protein
LRAEDGEDLDGALESAAWDELPWDEVVCAAAATAKMENTKIARKILFMLDLTTLELILPDSVLLERFCSSFLHFPEALFFWMQNRRGWGALILTRYQPDWEKTLPAAQAELNAKVQRPRGLACVDCQDR